MLEAETADLQMMLALSSDLDPWKGRTAGVVSDCPAVTLPRDDGKDNGGPESSHRPKVEEGTATDDLTPSSEFEEEQEVGFPEGGYGWVVVVCVLMLYAVTWGINTTYGVYTSFYISHSYFNGGTTLRYAFVGGLCVGIGMLCAPFSNRLTQRFGMRVPLMIGSLAIVLGQAMAGISSNYSTFLVCQGLLFGVGLGMTLVPSQPLIAHWFSRRLALAQGIANAGSGVGGLIFSNTTRIAIETVGVKYALIINGCIAGIVLLPVLALLRERAVELKAKNEPLKLSFLWHPGYFWVWTWGAFSMMGYFVSLYSLASYCTDGLGLSQTQGAGLQSILAAGQMIGRPLCGSALDRGGRLNMAILFTTTAGLACFCLWLPARTFAMLVFFAVIEGVVGGTVWSTLTPVSTSTVSVADLGSALNVFWLGVALPALFAQPIAVTLLDYSRSTLGRYGAETYTISIAFCGSLFLVAALLLYGAKWRLQGSPRIWQKT